MVDLDTLDGLDKAYTALISNARVSDQEMFLNRDRLVSIWRELPLPARARGLWESRFPELRAA